MMSDSKIEAQERGRAVAWAVNTGRIPLDRAPHWLDKLKQNPENRAIMAALAPGLIPGAPGVGHQNVNPVRQALDTGAPPPPPPSDRPTRTIELGGGLINMEAQLIGGKPRSEWTEQEGRDAALWAMGPRFRQGLKPPPEPQWFIPTEGISHTTDLAFIRAQAESIRARAERQEGAR
jgi:hypothetical protein